MTPALLSMVLVCSCGDFAADVERRAQLMAADVDTMPHVVKAGLRQLSFDARRHAARGAARERLRAELREIVKRNRAAFEAEIDWPAIEQAVRDAAKETDR